MKQHPILALALMAALCLSACSSDDPVSPVMPNEEPEGAEGYPEVPKPTSVDDRDKPDQSEINAVIRPIAGTEVDFVPTWTAGTFTWDIDIQTHYEYYNGFFWVDMVDPAGSYYNGTAHNSALRFEGGVVDLRNPYPRNADIRVADGGIRYQPMPKRLMLMESGVVKDTPYNPSVVTGECYFNFGPNYETREVTFNPDIFVGVWDLEVEADFLQRNKKRLYWVGIRSAPPLTNPVFMQRERFWERVLVDGTKTVTVDPGSSKTVTYTKTTGTSLADATSFAETLSAETGLEAYGVGTKISSSTESTFSTTRTIDEEESVAVSYQVTGIEGKTIVFSVWQSVERYSFVDEAGQPYTDPSYTFSDLGNAVVRGDHQILQSAIFDYEE